MPHALDAVINLSCSVPTSPLLLTLLNRSPRFVPTPSRCDHAVTFSFVLDFVRKVQWGHAIWSEQSSAGNRFGFLASSAWPPRGLVPPKNRAFSRRIVSAARHVLFSQHSCYGTPNLSPEEYALLDQLKSDRSIIVKPADKGGRWVVMDSEHYSGECLRLLRDAEFY